jgi:hypothetical protein
MSASLSEEIREGEADAPMPKKGKKKACKGCSKAKPCHKCSKDDALTVQEYLDACDLGIQGRSRTYIRARLDTAQERADQKCGKSAIAKGKKCRKGAGAAVQPVGKKPGLVKKAAHGAVALASAIASRRASKKRAASGDHFSEIFGSY